MGFFTSENFASRATDATRRDKAWDRAGKLQLVMRNRTILVAVLISPYLSQKEAATGVRVSAGSRSAPVGAPQKWGEAGSRIHVHLGGSSAHLTAAAASSTRPQRGRTAASATSSAAAARCSRGRRSAAAGGCCGRSELWWCPRGAAYE